MDLKNHNKLISPVLALIVLVSIIVLNITGKISLSDCVEYLTVNRAHAVYALLFLYVISPAVFLPTMYLTMIAGLLWGPFWGVLIDISGATLGSVLAFTISRYLARDIVQQRIKNSQFSWLLEKGSESGWRLNAFFRLNPIFPSALIGYYFGLTKIKVVVFALSTFIFLIPASIVFVLFGSSFATILMKNDPVGLAIKILVLLFSLVVWGTLAFVSRKIGFAQIRGRQ